MKGLTLHLRVKHCCARTSCQPLSFGYGRLTCTKWGHEISRRHFPSFPLHVHSAKPSLTWSLSLSYHQLAVSVLKICTGAQITPSSADRKGLVWLRFCRGAGFPAEQEREWDILGKDTMYSQHKHVAHSHICHTHCTVVYMTNTLHICAHGTFTYCTDVFRTQRHKCPGFELGKCEQFAIAMCPYYLFLGNR